MGKIKFRAWDAYNKKIIDLDDLESISMRRTAGRDDDFANFELMQFTGLKDKNGKEIYEGDILGGTPNMHKMEVIMGKYGWNVKFIDLGHKYTEPLRNDLFENFDVEVIGNIYENKELLSERKI